MLHNTWPLFCILLFVQYAYSLDLQDPVPFPPFVRLAFGHPFSVSWTLDGTETGDRLFLRVRKVDSEGSSWVTISNSVKLSDRKLTAQIDATPSTTSSLPSVAFTMEATDSANLDNSYSSISIAAYSDTLVTSTKNEPSAPPRTSVGQTVNPSSSVPAPQSSQSTTTPSDEKTTSVSLSSSTTTETSTSTNESQTVSKTSPSLISSSLTASSNPPSISSQPLRNVKPPMPVGPIVGGTIGGLTVLALVVFCIFLRNRHERSDLNGVPTPYGETFNVPVTKRERLELEMTEAQRQRGRLQSDLDGIQHRSDHEPTITRDVSTPCHEDGFENDAQRLRFEVGMMSERILELEEALQELGEDDRIPAHPPPDYETIADQSV